MDTQYAPVDLVWEDGWLYWREGNREEPSQGRVAKARDTCGAQVEVLADGQGDPRFMALDDKFVYFNVLMAGAVRRVLKAGGPVEDFYVSADDTHGIAVDKRAVYWSSWETGKVFRLAK